MPEGITLADDAAFDVFQVDEEPAEEAGGEEADADGIRIATAETVEDGAQLKVTFVEATDVATGEAYAIGEASVEEGAEEGAATVQVLDTARAELALDVEIDTAALADEPATVDWTLQTSAADTAAAQTARLELPGLTALADELGVKAIESTPTTDSAEPEQTQEESTVPSENHNLETEEEPAEEPKTEGEVKAGGEASDFKSVGLTITWCDNNSDDRPAIGDIAAGLSLQYSLDNGEYRNLFGTDGKVLPQAKSDLKLTNEQVVTLEKAGASTNGNTTGVGTYEFSSAAKVPHKLGGSAVTWRLNDSYVYGDNYVDGKQSDSVHVFKMLTGEVEFTVIGKIGGEKLSDVFGDDQADFFVFIADSDEGFYLDSGNAKEITVAEAAGKERYFTLTDDTVNGESACLITGRMPLYKTDGTPITYSIQYRGPQPSTANEIRDYYQTDYDNTASPNHGSDKSALHNGGTLYLRHVGLTSYESTKV